MCVGGMCVRACACEGVGGGGSEMSGCVGACGRDPGEDTLPEESIQSNQTDTHRQHL
jgi:hypothetical protein